MLDEEVIIHLMLFPALGWLPYATRHGKEIYRGEYRDTAEEALKFAKFALQEYIV